LIDHFNITCTNYNETQLELNREDYTLALPFSFSTRYYCFSWNTVGMSCCCSFKRIQQQTTTKMLTRYASWMTCVTRGTFL